MKARDFKILVYGYGNPGRQDDGVGIIVAEEIEKWCGENGYSGIDISQNYQLNIEDAEKIAHYHLVIFADASIKTIEPFIFGEVKSTMETEFSMHSISPSFVLGLSRKLFNSKVTAYKIEIKGEQWEFMEPTTIGARKNVDLAIQFLKKVLLKYLVPADKILT